MQKYKEIKFEATRNVGGAFVVDDNQKLWLIPDGRKGKIKNPKVYTVDEIISYKMVVEVWKRAGIMKQLLRDALNTKQMSRRADRAEREREGQINSIEIRIKVKGPDAIIKSKDIAICNAVIGVLQQLKPTSEQVIFERKKDEGLF